jgi:cytochrome b pre-mRNA-processing protein 3
MIVGKARRARVAAAYDLYDAAVAQSRRPIFYQSFGVADSLDGRFDLLTLHVFLILRRLGAEGRATRALAQALFDLMFADMDQTLRELGVSDVSVGRKVKAMVSAFYGRIEAYESGLTERSRLIDALKRNLYRGDPVDEPRLSALAAYIEAETASLAAQPTEALGAGRVAFGLPGMP